MVTKNLRPLWLAVAVLWAVAPVTLAESLRIQTEMQYQLYYLLDGPPGDNNDKSSFVSGSVTSEIVWRGEKNSMVFKPYIRFDATESDNSYLDIREAYWLHKGAQWSSLVGVNRVDWGVMESLSLVDIVNQVDYAANPDGSEKLGQPMLNFNWLPKWGEVAFFLLPRFREVGLPDGQTRPRLPLPLSERVGFESSSGKHHLDLAARVAFAEGAWEVAASAFKGTSRTPIVTFEELTNDLTSEGFLYYPLIRQYGLEVLHSMENRLVKLEAIQRRGFAGVESESTRSVAVAVGLEMFSYGINQSNADLTWIVEHQYSKQSTQTFNLGALGTRSISVVGARLNVNDFDTTLLQTGLAISHKEKGHYFYVEGSTRLSSQMVIAANLRLLRNFDRSETSLLADLLENESHLSLTINHFF